MDLLRHSDASSTSSNKNGSVVSKSLYNKTSALRSYPFYFGPEYEKDYQRNPKPKPSIVDPKIFPTGNDDGKGPSKILHVYVDHVLQQSQKKHQTQEIRLQHFTDHFLNSSFDEKLHSLELNNIPLASSISIQQNLNKPNLNSSQKQFFIKFNTRLKNNDGLLVYARLQNTNINDTILRFLCTGISRNNRLKILMLHHNFITDKGLEALCTALRHHPSIHTLWIGSNRITDFGVKTLAQLLSDNTMIKELNISNKFRKMNFSQEEEDIRPYLTYISADYLSNHLKLGSLLTSLTLSHQKMYDDGAILLYHALSACQLRSLNLTNNHLADKSCLVLQHVLSQNPLLEQLVLSNNEIGDAGAIAIAYGLIGNRNLNMLDLSENWIGEKGLFALYRSVQMYNVTLKSLITVKNRFDDSRAEAIAATRNNSVFSLGIRNTISMSYCNSFLEIRKDALLNDGELNGEDVYRPRAQISTNTRPNQKELRRSLLMNPDEDGHVLDEILQVNLNIETIMRSSKRDHDEFNAPKMIARSLSRSSLLARDSQPSLQLDNDMDKDEPLDSGETDNSPTRGGSRSFLDLLKSPFGHSDVFSSPSRAIAVPGVGVYGSKPLELTAIREETDSKDKVVSIRDAIATAVRIAETADSFTDTLKDPDDSLVASNQPPLEVPPPLTSSASSPPRRGNPSRRRSADLGRTTGVPHIKGYGIRPIRTNVSGTVDSGQHLMYLRVSTENDPPDARPYSMIKIGLDRLAERERIRKERQLPEYKEQKALKLLERPNKVHHEAAISRVSDRFWKDWELRMRDRYPRGVDLAKGCASTRLEPIAIPPAPINSSEIDKFSKYDRKDAQNPWNRYLEYKRHPELSYQRHLGFHDRKFAPGQVLAARRKEKFLKKLNDDTSDPS